MADIIEEYLTQMHEKFKYYAAWLPGMPLRLGDIGIIDEENRFVPKTTLAKQGISFDIRTDSTKDDDVQYSSSGTVSGAMKVSGQAMERLHVLNVADAGFIAEFNRENAVLFYANGVLSHRIEDTDQLTTDIAEKAREGTWKEKWVVITELLSADSATILISKAGNAKVEIKANSGVPAMNVASADAGLSVAYKVGMDTAIVAKNGLTPLFNIARLESPSAITGGIITLGRTGAAGTRHQSPHIPAKSRMPSGKGRVIGKADGAGKGYTLVSIPFHH